MCVNAAAGWSPVRIHTQLCEHLLAVCSAANGPCCSWPPVTASAALYAAFIAGPIVRRKSPARERDARMCF